MATGVSEAAASADRAPPALFLRLSAMMFLQYFVQGCYAPIISLYVKEALNFGPEAIGLFGSALAVGPVLAPFVVGQLVDRRFPSQYVIACCHAVGGVLMLVLYTQRGFWPVVIMGTIYSVMYVPTMMLTNAVAFHHLPNRDHFPFVRVFGTIGFIVPAWVIELFFLAGLEGEALNQGRGIALAVSGVSGLLMAAYCLFLPPTPPAKTSGGFAPGVAMSFFRSRDLLVLVLVSFGIAIVHNFYFTLNSPYLKAVLAAGGVTGAWEQRIASLGQIAEIGVMLVLPLFIARFGFKLTMIVGVTAYLLRCLIFAGAYQIAEPFALTLGIVCLGTLLHGVCFGCFLATAFIYLDRTTSPDIRGSVQTLYGTFVVGLGMFAGGLVSAAVGRMFGLREGAQTVAGWSSIWLSGAVIAAVCLVAFSLFFTSRAKPATG
jgi:nucleoside transporter